MDSNSQKAPLAEVNFGIKHVSFSLNYSSCTCSFKYIYFIILYKITMYFF